MNATACKKKLESILTYSKRLSLVTKDEWLSINKQSELLSISRSSVYYEKEWSQEDQEIMNNIDEIYTEFPCYGSRRMSKALLVLWYNVWRKKTRSLMQKMSLCAQYPGPNTSKANLQHKKYPYLLRWYKPSRANEVRSTDITYIRMARWWVYLIAIIDWYSRKIISRRLSTTLEVWPCVDCLKDALKQWTPAIFNTDQWSQFTSNEFVWVLLDKSIHVSMDGRGRATDNIYIERFWRSLKQEEVYKSEYDSPIEAQIAIGAYITKYNTRRLHSSLWYKYPSDVHEKSITDQNWRISAHILGSIISLNILILLSRKGDH